MNTNKTRPFFVLGLPNSATSTVVGIVNSHPEILVCYETWMLPPRVTQYTTRVCNVFPEIRKVFSGTLEIPDAYIKMGEIVAQHGIQYKYIGDKMVSFTLEEMQMLADASVLYIVRPLAEWLIKREVRRTYNTDLDTVVPALHYLRCLTFANSKPNWLRVSMQAMMDHPEEFIFKTAKYLGLDPNDFDRNWWKSLEHYSDPLKNSMGWAKAHPSSLMPPQHRPDITYQLKNHPFWIDVKNIEKELFSKIEVGISEAEKEELTVRIQSISDKYTIIPIRDLYSDLQENRHTPIPLKSQGFLRTFRDTLPIFKSWLK